MLRRMRRLHPEPKDRSKARCLVAHASDQARLEIVAFLPELRPVVVHGTIPGRHFFSHLASRVRTSSHFVIPHGNSSLARGVCYVLRNWEIFLVVELISREDVAASIEAEEQVGGGVTDDQARN